MGYEYEILESQKIEGPLLLCGGTDIGKDPVRDQKEFNWIKEALDSEYPIIGICRGMQILNKYFGGEVTTLEDLVVESHRSDDFSDDADHSERISQFHLVEGLDGKSIMVNSRHHQYCSKVADNFTVTYRSLTDDSIPEAFEDLDRNIWAVQWHPERVESDNNLYPLDKVFAK